MIPRTPQPFTNGIKSIPFRGWFRTFSESQTEELPRLFAAEPMYGTCEASVVYDNQPTTFTGRIDKSHYTYYDSNHFTPNNNVGFRYVSHRC